MPHRNGEVNHHHSLQISDFFIIEATKKNLAMGEEACQGVGIKNGQTTTNKNNNLANGGGNTKQSRNIEDNPGMMNNGGVINNAANNGQEEGSQATFPCDDPAIIAKPSDFAIYTNGLADKDFDEQVSKKPKKIYRVVLTGGPCGGKTTGQARLCTFFENLGWKVFRVPETATVLLSGGIKFSELTPDQALQFQEELVRTMMQIERSYFRMAETIDRDVLIICDRGAMDASAYIPRDVWEGILGRNGWNEVDLRDARYNHIIHMVSAANGAETFYTTDDHTCRTESLQLAKDVDRKCAQAWVGHPYFDVIDNSTDFEKKLCRMIQAVCQKLGIDADDRLQNNSRKRKFLVKGPLPKDDMFPQGFQDFTVIHDYLQTNTAKMQVRLRKRGQKGHWSYSYTVRHPEIQGQVVEVRTPLTQRDYHNMLSQRDTNHFTVYKDRRCFLIDSQYYQLDIYKEPCHPRCKGLMFLETYTTVTITELQQKLPAFLNIMKEVTGDPRYSMFNLSLKERWQNNKHFCQSLAGSDSEESLDEISSTENRLILS